MSLEETRCHKVRREARLYAQEVARAAGITESRMRFIEHRRSKPTPAEALAIERALRCEPGSLFGPDDITPRKGYRAPEESRREAQS